MYPSENILKLGRKDSYSKSGVYRGVPQVGVSYVNDVLTKMFDLQVYSDTKRQHIIKEGWMWNTGMYPQGSRAAYCFAGTGIDNYGRYIDVS